MKKETVQKICLISLSVLICFADGCFKDVKAQDKKEQLPRLDTSGIVITLTDKEGVKHQVFKSETGRSYVIVDGKRRNLYRKPENN